jgi:hypothetical protein
MFAPVLLIIVQKWKNTKYSSTKEWIKNTVITLYNRKLFQMEFQYMFQHVLTLKICYMKPAHIPYDCITLTTPNSTRRTKGQIIGCADLGVGTKNWEQGL